MRTFVYIISSLVLFLGSCTKMDYNYKEYLDENRVYSPKVLNLEAESLLKEVKLSWDNPPGDVAKYLVIDYQDSVITTETMIDSILLTNLEIKGYTISVITKDAFGNSSVPAIVTAFPNGEEELK